jgi:protein-ribulosamine 3-kinase
MGKMMMEGEFNSMMAIYTYIPTFAPKPLAWGKFKESPPDTYFFLMEFLDLSPELPDPIDFCSTLAQLHQMSHSPTGKFGFSSITCHGPNWHQTEWHESWCYYFTRLLDQFFSRWMDHFGPDPQFERAFQDLQEHAIPQVLEPLQAEGRVLKPCLIHGDLWEENSGTNLASDQPVVFDAAVMYAHNEFELGMWRRDVVRFGKAYVRQYLRHMPPSEPFDQWDDRNRLYSIKYDLAHGIALPGTAQTQREMYVQYMSDSTSMRTYANQMFKHL